MRDFYEFEDSLMDDGIVFRWREANYWVSSIKVSFKEIYKDGPGTHVVSKIDYERGIVTLAMTPWPSSLEFFAKCANISPSDLAKILKSYKCLCLTSRSDELMKLAEEFYKK